jgi:hypothetical protein
MLASASRTKWANNDLPLFAPIEIWFWFGNYIASNPMLLKAILFWLGSVFLSLLFRKNQGIDIITTTVKRAFFSHYSARITKSGKRQKKIIRPDKEKRRGSSGSRTPPREPVPRLSAVSP